MKSINYQHIFDFSLPPLQLLHRVLAAAGFLLNDRGEHLEFSSNSAMQGPSSDPKFLTELGERHRWFRVSGMHVFATQPVEPADLESFFDRTVQSEAGGVGQYEDWRRFSNYRLGGGRQPAANLPAAILEPRIAGLVRAFRDVGIHTYMSCHGHPAPGGAPAGGVPPRVWFFTPISFLWTQILLESRYTELCTAARAGFRVGNYELFFPFLDQFPDSGWKALFEIGWQMYNERFVLRELKANLCARVAGTPMEDRLVRYGSANVRNLGGAFVELRALMEAEVCR